MPLCQGDFSPGTTQEMTRVPEAWQDGFAPFINELKS